MEIVCFRQNLTERMKVWFGGSLPKPSRTTRIIPGNFGAERRDVTPDPALTSADAALRRECDPVGGTEAQICKNTAKLEE